MKQITNLLIGDNLQETLQRGISQIADLVKRTLGPGGQPIIIERNGKDIYNRDLSPLVTKDGVTVAESIKRVPDVHENNAIQAIKDVARQTNSAVGDGTTTAVVLAQAIFEEALKRTKTGTEPQRLLNELNRAADSVVASLNKFSKKVETTEEIVSVASISANNNKEIGNIVNQAIEAVGEDGVITLEEGSSRETTLRIVEGFQIDRGLLGQHHFVTHPDRGECVLEKCAVVVYNGEITRASQLISLVEKITKQGNDTDQSFLIIANDVVGEALNFLIINKAHSQLRCAAIKGPNVTNVRTQMMEDIATMVGGSVLGTGSKGLEEVKHEFDDEGNLLNSDLGFADKVIVGRFNTVVYGGAGEEEVILKRVDDLKKLKEGAHSPYDRDQINQRIACLSNGVAIIGCGGATEMEIKEKKDRIEDALNSTRAAIERGIVPGGGVALLRARQVLEGQSSEGASVLFKALGAPIRQIISNIGESPDIIVNKVLANEKLSYGFDARTGKFDDLFKCGIVDPTKVVESALINAISIAGLLMTCGGSVVTGEESDE